MNTEIVRVSQAHQRSSNRLSHVVIVGIRDMVAEMFDEKQNMLI